MAPRTPGMSPAGGGGRARGPAGSRMTSAIAAMTRTARRRMKRNTARASRPRMKTVVHRPHPLLKDVRVNLRRREIRVAQHHLDGTQIGATLEEMGGERMTQHVRAERRGDACAPPIRLQHLPEAAARQSSSAAPRVDE